MVRWLSNFFQYLFELFTAPFRIAGMWRQHSAYDEHGYFNFLKEREDNPDAFVVEGVTPEVVDRALGVFCEAFDIMPVQKYCLRPNDKITTLYCAMVTGCWDQQEMERLSQRLEAETGVPLTEADMGQFDTLEDLVVWFNLNRREARAEREAQEAARAKEEEAKAEQAANSSGNTAPESQGPEKSEDAPERQIAEKHQPEPSRGGEGLSF